MIWYVFYKWLDKKGISITYIQVIKDMYEEVRISMSMLGEDTNGFPSHVCLHQGSTIAPFVFTIVMRELAMGIQEEVSWCMHFAEDVALHETKEVVKNKLRILARNSLSLIV